MRKESATYRQPMPLLFVWDDLGSTLGCCESGFATRAVGVHAQPHLRSNQRVDLSDRTLGLVQIRKVNASIRGLHNALSSWSLRIGQYICDLAPV
jgi:hypothetical protein